MPMPCTYMQANNKQGEKPNYYFASEIPHHNNVGPIIRDGTYECFTWFVVDTDVLLKRKW